jgi:hypothetical protein
VATSRISNTIKSPNGTAIAGVPVSAVLMPSAGFRISDFSEVARIVTTTTDAAGFWQLDLERNANVTPTNSWYEVIEAVPNASGGRRVWNIAVGASDQSLLASLVTPAQQQPTVVPAGTVYLDQASADARYQAVGSLGAATPGRIDPDDPGTAGVATSASRSDHEHPITTGTPVAVGAANAEGSGTGFARDTHVHLGTGTLGFASVTANQAGITTPLVDLTGLSVAVTVVSGRRVKITGFAASWQSNTVNDRAVFTIREGSTSLATVVTPMDPIANNGNGGGAVLWVGTPSAGAHTYKLSAASVDGGSLTLEASATTPAFILVEDIGV